MKESSYKSYDELPLFLNATTVAKVLGVSPSSGYELMHEPDFPVLRFTEEYCTTSKNPYLDTNIIMHEAKETMRWVRILTRPPSRGQRKNIKIFHSTAGMLYCGNWKFG